PVPHLLHTTSSSSVHATPFVHRPGAARQRPTNRLSSPTESCSGLDFLLAALIALQSSFLGHKTNQVKSLDNHINLIYHNPVMISAVPTNSTLPPAAPPTLPSTIRQNSGSSDSQNTVICPNIL